MAVSGHGLGKTGKLNMEMGSELVIFNLSSDSCHRFGRSARLSINLLWNRWVGMNSMVLIAFYFLFLGDSNIGFLCL